MAGKATRKPIRRSVKVAGAENHPQAHDKEIKNDLAIRPVHHQLDRRVEAHIFVSFLAYALQVTLKT